MSLECVDLTDDLSDEEAAVARAAPPAPLAPSARLTPRPTLTQSMTPSPRDSEWAAPPPPPAWAPPRGIVAASVKGECIEEIDLTETPVARRPEVHFSPCRRLFLPSS